MWTSLGLYLENEFNHEVKCLVSKNVEKLFFWYKEWENISPGMKSLEESVTKVSKQRIIVKQIRMCLPRRNVRIIWLLGRRNRDLSRRYVFMSNSPRSRSLRRLSLCWTNNIWLMRWGLLKLDLNRKSRRSRWWFTIEWQNLVHLFDKVV